MDISSDRDFQFRSDELLKHCEFEDIDGKKRQGEVDPENWTGWLVCFMLLKPLSMEIKNDQETTDPKNSCLQEESGH